MNKQGNPGSYREWANTTSFEIAPYSEHEIDAGNSVSDTLSLVSCNAAAVELICDGRKVRLDQGSTLPANGYSRKIRNPYSRTIKGCYLRGHDVSILRHNSETQAFSSVHHQTLFTMKSPAEPGFNKGFVFMPKRGSLEVNARGSSNMNVSILPRARVEYAEQMPPGMLENKADFFFSNGEVNENVVCKQGKFNDAMTAEWVASTAWKMAPVRVSSTQSNFKGFADEKTALIVWFNSGNAVEAEVRAHDLGEWS